MSNNPMKRRKRKHVSQLNATGRARADQLMQFALLAIVQSQDKIIMIPYDDAEQTFDTHRLKVSLIDGNIVLEAEKQDSRIIAPDSKLLQ